MLFIKAFTSYFHIYRPPPPSAVASHIVRHHPSYCAVDAIHHHRRKTAEERFNMLARGWLAYPVTPIHSLLPPKSGCIRQHMVGLHSLVAERRHSSVTRYAKRSVACRDSPRHQPLRAGGTPLPRPSAVASLIGLRITHRPPSPIGLRQRRNTPPCEKPPKSGLIC